MGRTIFAAAVRDWMLDKITNGEAVNQMKNNYAALCAIWDKARAAGGQ